MQTLASYLYAKISIVGPYDTCINGIFIYFWCCFCVLRYIYSKYFNFNAMNHQWICARAQPVQLSYVLNTLIYDKNDFSAIFVNITNHKLNKNFSLDDLFYIIRSTDPFNNNTRIFSWKISQFTIVSNLAHYSKLMNHLCLFLDRLFFSVFSKPVKYWSNHGIFVVHTTKWYRLTKLFKIENCK